MAWNITLQKMGMQRAHRLSVSLYLDLRLWKGSLCSTYEGSPQFAMDLIFSYQSMFQFCGATVQAFPQSALALSQSMTGIVNAKALHGCHNACILNLCAPNAGKK